MIRVRGEASGRTYDYKCDLVSRTDDEAVFTTRSEPQHQIRVTPRYVGSRIGNADCRHEGYPATVCFFVFDGEYVALAFFIKRGSHIEILVHEY